MKLTRATPIPGTPQETPRTVDDAVVEALCQHIQPAGNRKSHRVVNEISCPKCGYFNPETRTYRCDKCGFVGAIDERGATRTNLTGTRRARTKTPPPPQPHPAPQPTGILRGHSVVKRLCVGCGREFYVSVSDGRTWCSRRCKPTAGPVDTELEQRVREERRRERVRTAQAERRDVWAQRPQTLLTPQPSEIQTYTCDAHLAHAVEHAVADQWWHQLTDIHDDAEYRVPCDLCGQDITRYVATGGLVVCWRCWRLTATDEELRRDWRLRQERPDTAARLLWRGHLLTRRRRRSASGLSASADQSSAHPTAAAPAESPSDYSAHGPALDSTDAPPPVAGPPPLSPDRASADGATDHDTTTRMMTLDEHDGGRANDDGNDVIGSYR